MSDDKMNVDIDPDLGISTAQSAILDMMTSSDDDKSNDSDERVDESDVEEEIETEGEALEEFADEDAEALDGDDIDADLDDDEQEPEELVAAETYTVKVAGEDVEVELDELLNGYSRQSDYTKKSQALAQERTQFQQDRDAVTLERQQYAQLLGALQQQLNMTDEPAPDFDRLYEEDPIEATKLERKWREKTAAKQEKLQAIQLEQQRVEAANQQMFQANMQQMLQEEVGKLPSVIPEWRNDDTANREREELRQYLLDAGVAEEEMQSLVRANHIAVLRKAMLYDKGQTRVKNAKKGKSKSVRPGAKSAQQRPTSKLQKNARQRLAKSGRIDDAAGLIESML